MSIEIEMYVDKESAIEDGRTNFGRQTFLLTEQDLADLSPALRKQVAKDSGRGPLGRWVDSILVEHPIKFGYKSSLVEDDYSHQRREKYTDPTVTDCTFDEVKRTLAERAKWDGGADFLRDSLRASINEDFEVFCWELADSPIPESIQDSALTRRWPQPEGRESDIQVDGHYLQIRDFFTDLLEYVEEEGLPFSDSVEDWYSRLSEAVECHNDAVEERALEIKKEKKKQREEKRRLEDRRDQAIRDILEGDLLERYNGNVAPEEEVWGAVRDHLFSELDEVFEKFDRLERHKVFREIESTHGGGVKFDTITDPDEVSSGEWSAIKKAEKIVQGTDIEVELRHHVGGIDDPHYPQRVVRPSIYAAIDFHGRKLSREYNAGNDRIIE